MAVEERLSNFESASDGVRQESEAIGRLKKYAL
jgi:hypothetical protein